MVTGFRLSAVIASALIVIAGVGFFVGGYMASVDDCVSGTSMVFEPVAESDVDDLNGNTTAFENLTAVEQRIFLEAYTNLNNGFGDSDIYANWSEERFSKNPGTGMSTANIPVYVEYRGEYYEGSEMATDCGISTGTLVQIASILSGLTGAVTLVVVGAWRVLNRYR